MLLAFLEISMNYTDLCQVLAYLSQQIHRFHPVVNVRQLQLIAFTDLQSIYIVIDRKIGRNLPVAASLDG